MSIQKLTDKEEELMDFFWNSSQPLSSKDILELVSDRSWKDSYTYALLVSLNKKGMLNEVGKKLYNTQYARLYCCSMSREEYYVRLAYSRGVDRKKFIRLMYDSLNERNEKI